MKKNKAQTAIYIIIGILIVTAVILIIFIRLRATPDETITHQTYEINLVDKEMRDVYYYVDRNLDSIVKDSLEILRLQGGYIELPTDTPLIPVKTEGKHVGNLRTNDNLLGELKVYNSSGTTLIPQWIGINEISVPSVEFMEYQMKNYIESRLYQLNFSDIINLNISKGLPNVTVVLGEKVSVDVEYRILGKLENTTHEIKKFHKEYNLNFTEIYSILLNLVNNEIYNNYLESHTKQLISLYSYSGDGKREDDVPPVSFTEANTDCSYASWTKSEVKSTLKSIMAKNFKYLKIAKTKFQLPDIADTMKKGVYESFVHEYFKDMKNIAIDFSYDPDNTFNVYIEPASLQPEKMVQTKIPYLPMFCSFDYSFAYTVAFPVVVKFTDYSSKLNGNYFTFYFPMISFVCMNNPRICYSGIELQLNPNQTKELSSSSASYDCYNTTYKSIKVLDSSSSGVEGATIIHHCQGFSNTCILGKTNANGEASIELPICQNSSLEIYKEGYSSINEPVKDYYILERDKSFNLSVKLVNVKKFMIAYAMTNGFTTVACNKDPQQWLSESISTPVDNDQILISFQQKLTTFPSTKLIDISPGEKSVGLVLTSLITIKPSNYGSVLVGFNNKNNPFNDRFILGYLNYNINLTSKDLASKTKALFYVFSEKANVLEVSDFDNPLIRDKKLSGTIEINRNCDNNYANETITITEEEYLPFVKMQLS